MKLFTYGSLMRGESNAHWMEGASWLRNTSTLPHYLLLDMGGYPALVDGGAQSVVGELYEVDDSLIARLDRLEGHPDYYLRTSISLECGATALTYVLQPQWVSEGAIIHSADWRTFRRERYAANSPYVGERWEDL